MKSLTTVFLFLLPFLAPPLSSQVVRTGLQTSVKRSTIKQDGALSKQLDKLYATATIYATSLAKITCVESIHSEQNSFGFSRPIHWKLDTRGEFTVVKSATGVAGFTDSHVYSEKDGKPIPSTKTMEVPYMLNDAFAPAIISYLAPERRACLHFSMARDRIIFETVHGMGGHGLCADIAPEAKGYVVFDRVTNTVSHFERTVPLQASLAGGFAPFASVDYMAYGFMGHLMMLPAHIVATKTAGSLNYSFDGKYGACQLFQPTVKIYDANGKELPPPHDR